MPMTIRNSSPYFLWMTDSQALSAVLVGQDRRYTGDRRRAVVDASTRGLLRRRLTLPLASGVVTTRASPSRATQTAVDTGSPCRAWRRSAVQDRGREWRLGDRP
jgi:hypothetical protein